MSEGWIEPPDKTVAGDWWVTRRSADSLPQFDLKLPDLRRCFRWNGREAWVTGYFQGARNRVPWLSCLHSNNGWRLEGPA